MTGGVGVGRIRFACTIAGVWAWFGCGVLDVSLWAVSPLSEPMKIERSIFGTLDGEDVHAFTMSHPDGSSIRVMEYGATLMEVNVADASGKIANVNAVLPTLRDYTGGHPYFGSTVGRFANRIGDAKFEIDGAVFELPKNHGEHILHGGPKNFAHQVWRGEAIEQNGDSENEVAVRMTLQSPDEHNGFPGNVSVQCVYRFTAKHEVVIEYVATTDAPTHLNLTNHSYFNLGGMGSGSVHDHVLTIPSTKVLEVDDDLIPHGGMMSVDGTPFDFREPTAIGDRIDQLPATKGYDHCYVVVGFDADSIEPIHAAEAFDPASGRTMTVTTTLPGMQLYTGNHLGGGASAAGLSSHEAFCLETQSFPNSPNVESFPSTLVRPDQTLKAMTVYRFGVRQR